ncbi:peptidoglycan-binding domain-containing protein [Yinghuangia aomiensis]
MGDVVRQGETVYRVNGRPVPLFVGDAPLWRALGKGVANGSDVRILERNLVALGYGKDLQVDDKFTDATAAAVQRWQKALGVPQTGRVDPSAVVVQPGAVRVTALKASVGAPAQGEVAAVSGTNRQVTVPLPVDKQALARKGAKVSVRLPDGRTTPGTVAEIGTVATKNEGDGGGGPPGGGGGMPVIQVTVTLDKPDEAGALDRAPVNVGFTSQSRDERAVRPGQRPRGARRRRLRRGGRRAVFRHLPPGGRDARAVRERPGRGVRRRADRRAERTGAVVTRAAGRFLPDRPARGGARVRGAGPGARASIWRPR